MKFLLTTEQVILIFLKVVFFETVLPEGSRKKQLPETTPLQNVSKLLQLKSQPFGNVTATPINNIYNSNHTINNIDNEFIQTDDDIPESFLTGFYILIGVGLIGLCFIVFKAYRLRMSRAERRYGVRGDRSAQELTPLPMAIEDDDSDTEDQTVFDIHRVS